MADITDGKPEVEEPLLNWALMPQKALEEVLRVIMLEAKDNGPNAWKSAQSLGAIKSEAVRSLEAWGTGTSTFTDGTRSLAWAAAYTLYLLWHDMRDEVRERTDG